MKQGDFHFLEKAFKKSLPMHQSNAGFIQPDKHLPIS